MGGEGAMAAANASLKYNRAQLNRKKLKDLKSLYLGSYSKEKPKFKEVSKEELLDIKKQIQEKALSDRKKANRRTAIVFGLLIIGIITFIFLINKDIIKI